MSSNKKSRDMVGAKAAWQLSAWIEPWGESRFPIDIDRLVLGAHTMYRRADRISRIISGPWQDFEGFLQRNPDDPQEWLLSFREGSSPERQRFTKAHELGHYVLHADADKNFKCGAETIVEHISSADKRIEFQANQFASHLLMPSSHVSKRIAKADITFDLVSELAAFYGVSFEAMCIRIVETTGERAVLVYWDNGLLLRLSRSEAACTQGLWIDRQKHEPIEPVPGTLAADATVRQCPEGRPIPAKLWFKNMPEGLILREMKHTSDKYERVLSLLIVPKFESIWTRNDDERVFDTYDRFIENGQLPVR